MTRFIVRAVAGVLLLAGALAAGNASANVCTVTATPIAFGAYESPNGAYVDSTGTITVTCTPDYLLLACSQTYTVALNQGAYGTFAARKMASGSAYLEYNLFTTTGRGTVWGTGSGNGVTVPGAVTSSLLNLVCLPGSTNHTIFARIPANQNVPVGVYTDNITVTVTY